MKEIDNTLLIKVGTNTLTTKKHNREQLDFRSFDRIGRQIVDIAGLGINPVLITSAGITAGMIMAGISQRPDKGSAMPELQRLACIGWGRLLQVWDIYTADMTVGGLLLTRRELEEGSRERTEALNTIHAMLSYGDLPVINENDATTHEEIAFGDNDRLAATLALEMKKAKVFGGVLGLVMLSNIPGICEVVEDETTLVRVVEDVESVQDLIHDKDTEISNGGMASKLEAAKIVTAVGIDMWVANGREQSSIQRAMNGQIGTHFVARTKDNVE